MTTWSPPYIFVGLYVLECQPLVDAHVRDYERLNVEKEVRTATNAETSQASCYLCNERAKFQWAPTTPERLASLKRRPRIYDVVISPDAIPADNAGEFTFGGAAH